MRTTMLLFVVLLSGVENVYGIPPHVDHNDQIVMVDVWSRFSKSS